jgi:SAM-dependent methyltransferase
MHHELFTNKKCWDHVAEKYFGACSLPSWGPFDVCVDRDLLGSVTDKTVLEIGCGSGHSISYLAQLGVKKAYGLDISTTQISLATELNRAHIESGRVELFEAPMELRLGFADIDIVFSIHAIGWTRDPKALFENLWSYLKPGGKLVWSWGHPLFGMVKYEAGNFVLLKSYFDESAWFEEGWSGSEGVFMQTRTIASWFRYLRDAGFTVRDFLEPEPASTAVEVSDPSRYYSTAKARGLPCTMVFVCEKT